MSRILVIQGHPDPAGGHLCHALAEAYVDAARAAGHQAEIVTPVKLDFPMLANAHEWEEGELPPALAPVKRSIAEARHIVIFYPLWLGDMPASLKAFLEQVARPGFALDRQARNPLHAGLLAGRSARVVVTMGMPALFYRWYFCAHSLKSLERNILNFVGIAPVRKTLVGGAGKMDATAVAAWRQRMQVLGAKGI
ncbi:MULTISPECIES: NAD(P)H-dependent oxidoreductase [unclassified Duganella]|uniref:NAD(P)H-dependent oxidoreductase n=1 Tax=unclassified Duganella TaxID=2636909 RepID=UPI000700892E|nr:MULTISPECIES: NAD(P)H-dependent oxidoreductase [unclassified Duganella]KQV61843.1 dehydrogenase [Duganella sp. Root336D2]KRB84350.1 dehydrogenase [Duganella sp. Root198D2]